ncbi:MAG: flagellar biosynthesis protein FlhA [Firmicutes bacterium]|nr:flagellar biosynthesis protein FlhA [Bacillota bacterium]
MAVGNLRTANLGIARRIPVNNLAKYSDILVAVAIVAILVMMIIPMPTMVLDVLLTLNITGALVILLVTLYALEPLDFSAFPSLLLIATLFRLALNVSSTRLILLHAYAGRVIESFGNFVVGGNYVVGMVVFLILVVIQFIVITNGAGRVAEVAARFTLDAMPGKQMSIDADLNAGLITEQEARARRRAIEQEADFYGAMDGASKFVRGDAIAGIIITCINILGGIVIGVIQLKMPVMEALQRYALLTVGDGLVSQIPALLISTATGIIVTRAASESNLGEDLARQVLAQPRAVAIGAGMLLLFGMVPGLPKAPFFMIAIAAGALAYALYSAGEAATEEAAPKPADQPRAPENFMNLLAIDPLELEIGYGLIPLTDEAEGGDLLNRVTMVRRQVALELGLVLPHIRIRDNIQLRPGEYAIRIKGVELARGEILMGRYLAMNPGLATEPVPGIEVREPAFGLPAIWVTEDVKENAEAAGYTVVDPSSVIVTHLAEVIKAHAAEILGRQDVSNLLDNLKQSQPAVVEEVVPSLLTIGEVQKVLQNLLRERISIRDMATILEALGDYARVTRDIDALTEYARAALARNICRQYKNAAGELVAATIDPGVEDIIAQAIQHSEAGSTLALEPAVVHRFTAALAKQAEKMVESGNQPVVLCRASVRPYVRRLTERLLPNLVVLSYNEIVPDQKVRTVGMVSIDNAN